MGYTDRVYKYTCPRCNIVWTIQPKGPDSIPSYKHKCKCGTQNRLAPLSEFPTVDRTIYLGHDNSNLVKVHPVPPGKEDEPWAAPYSVRSFLYQASRHLGGCRYSCRAENWLYGEPVFRDECISEIVVNGGVDHVADAENCNVLAGWAIGKQSCALWEKISALCQTPTEQRFLKDYIRYVKDRQFPMLLPQVRIGIAERRRPDFVVFIPLQFWRYEKLAIQLDHAHGDPLALDDKARDEYLAEHNYETISMRPKERGYLEEVKRLVERIDIDMRMVETDPLDIAVHADVRRSEPPHAWEDDPPM